MGSSLALPCAVHSASTSWEPGGGRAVPASRSAATCGVGMTGPFATIGGLPRTSTSRSYDGPQGYRLASHFVDEWRCLRRFHRNRAVLSIFRLVSGAFAGLSL